jgi:hypothetical protein
MSKFRTPILKNTANIQGVSKFASLGVPTALIILIWRGFNFL